MKFIPQPNGSSPLEKPEFLTLFCNCVLEQLCIIRAKVDLLDAIVMADVLKREGLSSSPIVSDERQKSLQKYYDRACEQVLKQLEGNWPEDNGKEAENPLP